MQLLRPLSPNPSNELTQPPAVDGGMAHVAAALKSAPLNATILDLHRLLIIPCAGDWRRAPSQRLPPPVPLKRQARGEDQVVIEGMEVRCGDLDASAQR